MPTPRSKGFQLDAYDWHKAGRDLLITIIGVVIVFLTETLWPGVDEADVLPQWAETIVAMSVIPALLVGWRFVRDNRKSQA